MSELLQQLVNGVVSGSGLVLAALGLNLVFGVLGVVNFAHGAFYVFGGYLTYTLMNDAGLDYWLSLIVTGVLVGAVAGLLDPLFFRRLRGRGELATIVATFGLALCLEEVVRIAWGASPLTIASPYADEAVRAGKIFINTQLLLSVAGTAILVVLLQLLLQRTWIGLQIRALAADPKTAELMGIRVNLVSGLTWAVAGAITAVGGALILPATTLQPQIGASLTTLAFAVVIIGGIGSMGGTVLAGMILGVAMSLVDGYVMSGVTDVVAFTVLLLVLLARPQGLRGRAA